MIGIYKITNTSNNKVYIGSSLDIGQRWHNHIKCLEGQRHVNPHLQSAWNKYGAESFKFEILRETSNLILRKAEQFYIDKYNSLDRTIGYNKTIVISKREEKILEAKERKQETKTNYFGAYTKDGKLFKVFRDKHEIIKYFNTESIGTIYQSTQNSATLSGLGYYWIRFDVSTGTFPKTIYIKGRKGRHRSIQQFDLNNNLLGTYDSAVEAAKVLGLSSFSITRCLGKDNKYKGFKWYYSAIN